MLRHIKPAVRWVLDNTPFGDQLRPAWFDEARLIIQGSEFELLTAEVPFRGRVLNAGCGEGLYSGFLEGFRDVT
jgi:SAM-dependent methyltransferase